MNILIFECIYILIFESIFLYTIEKLCPIYIYMKNRKKTEKASNVKIIGEGTYGCVVKPSLKCNTSHDYKNKVSKLMHEEDALAEQSEMKILNDIAGIKDYTMSYPELCKPKLDTKDLPYNFLEIAGKCNVDVVKTALNNKKYHELSLLLLDDGGVDLHQFVNNIFNKLDLAQQNIFFTSIINLLNGLLFFIKNEIIHHDIKLANIVYNITTGDAKFIDFGLMTTKTKFIEQSIENKNGLAIIWDYFPPEISCANNDIYKKEECKTLLGSNSKGEYKQFLDTISDSIDGYCLSFALYDMFKIIRTQKMYKGNPEFIDKVINLLYKFVGESKPEGYKRKKDYQELRDSYHKFANEYQVIDKKKPTPSKEIRELSHKLIKSTLIANLNKKPTTRIFKKKQTMKNKSKKKTNLKKTNLKKNKSKKKRISWK